MLIYSVYSTYMTVEKLGENWNIYH
jgi:hypothetical protein